MDNGITINSKPFEILTSRDPERLAGYVNDALEKGYELSWGGVSVRGEHVPYPFVSAIGLDTLYSQAVILKDKAKFDAWASEKKRVQEEAAAQAKREAEEETKRREERFAIAQSYLSKHVEFKPNRPLSPMTKGGRAIIKHVDLDREDKPWKFLLKRENVSRIIEADASEVTFLD